MLRVAAVGKVEPGRVHAGADEGANHILAVRDAMGRPVATILDTKGPEIRIKGFDTKSITLEAGDPFTLTTEDVVTSFGYLILILCLRPLCYRKRMKLKRGDFHKIPSASEKK